MDTMKATKMQPATDAVIKELRMLVQDFKLAGSPMILQTMQMSELLDRLEAAEKERDALRAEVIHIKEVEFPRKAQAVADGWRGKCERLEAKVEQMERQEPVAWLHETRRDSDVVTDAVKHVWGKAAVGAMAAYSIPLYALPGAKGEEK